MNNNNLIQDNDNDSTKGNADFDDIHQNFNISNENNVNYNNDEEPVSTGAQSNFYSFKNQNNQADFFFQSDQIFCNSFLFFGNNNQNQRIKQTIFKNKQSDSYQVLQMKKKANDAIFGNLIMIPKQNDQQMEKQLLLIAQQVTNQINQIKKGCQIKKEESISKYGYGQTFVDQTQQEK